jgi:hypothetical protein
MNVFSIIVASSFFKLLQIFIILWPDSDFDFVQVSLSQVWTYANDWTANNTKWISTSSSGEEVRLTDYLFHPHSYVCHIYIRV